MAISPPSPLPDETLVPPWTAETLASTDGVAAPPYLAHATPSTPGSVTDEYGGGAAARAPTELCLAAQYAVSLMLVESDTLDDVMVRVLGSIGESLGWPLGVFWRVENQRTGMLRRYTTWHAPARACAEPGGLITIDGELASRVWARGEPAWITCSGPSDAVLPVATGGDWYGAIAFPVQGGCQILGVMEFRGSAFHTPDPHLIQTVTVLGRMIGQFILLKSLQDQVRESDKLFRDTFEQAAVGIAHAALDGRFLLINQKLCDITGYTRDELLQRGFQDVTHPDDLAIDLAQAHRLLAGEIQTYTREKRFIRKDGAPIWINLTVSLARDPAGTPRHSIRVIEDISLRKQAENAGREIRQAERHRIARDLHDDVLQDLADTLGSLQVAQLRARDAGVGITLEQEIDALQRAAHGLHAAIYNLRCEGSQQPPFIQVLQFLVQLTRTLAPDLHVALVVQDGFPTTLPGTAKVELAHILREALTNTRRHAAACHVSVTLGGDGQDVWVTVADDGRGFASEAAANGMGLTGMRERAQALGGTLEIRGTPGKGTHVRFHAALSAVLRANSGPPYQSHLQTLEA